MPLDFDDPLPPTLGKKRLVTETQDQERELTHERIRDALRVMGGMMKVASEPNDRKRVEKYRREIEYQVQQEENYQSTVGVGNQKSLVSDPPSHKVTEWREYYAKNGAYGVSPGWLPPSYRPFSESKAKEMVKYMRRPIYNHDSDALMGSFSPSVHLLSQSDHHRIVVKDGSIAWSVVYSNESVERLEESHLADIIWNDVNYGIVAVGMSRKAMEREERKSNRGWVTEGQSF